MLIETFSGDMLNSYRVSVYNFLYVTDSDTAYLYACGQQVAVFETRELAKSGAKRLASLLAESGRALITQEDIHGLKEAATPEAISVETAPLKYRLGWLNDRGQQRYDDAEFDSDFDTVRGRRTRLTNIGSPACGYHLPCIYLVEDDGFLTLMEE